MTEIKFLHDLKNDFVDLVDREAEGVEMESTPHRTRGYLGRQPRMLTAVGLVVVIALAAGVLILRDRSTAASHSAKTAAPASTAGRSTVPPNGSNNEFSIAQPAFGTDPYLGGLGSAVTEATAQTLFGSHAPTGVGPLLSPAAGAANENNLEHTWVGPADGGHGAIGVVREYASGIRIDANPATDPTIGIDQMKAGFEAEASSSGPECGVQTIQGVPAELCHGDGQPVTFGDGASQTVNGTMVRLYLHGVIYDVWAGTELAEDAVVAAANSLSTP